MRDFFSYHEMRGGRGRDLRQMRDAQDLMFLREQSSLTADDLHKLLKPCRAAYEANVGAPTLSPHARFDCIDWLPLDP